MTQNQYLSVSQFNKKMKLFFDNEPSFKEVHVKGEVSGPYTSARGHFYFTLKDKSSVVSCIVYQWFRKNIDFEIKDGMKLLVIANVGVYPPHGKYQLDVRLATEDGLGKLYVKMQQLKEKLKKEGLFDKEHKKPLPEYPKRIGVVTSKGGSVIHDILKTVKQNWPYCEVILFPSAVQGANAKNELIKQIRKADSFNLDVLIVGRGGGSLEDLWSFNEESVVRTVFECNTPVISAIGHEDDVTLTDLVADIRASTPTMAASFAIKNKEEVLNNINHLNMRLISFMSSKLDEYKKQFGYMLSKPLFVDKTYVYGSKKSDFDGLQNRFYLTSNDMINSRRVMLDKITSEYVIRHPCKMQLDSSTSDLNELRICLFDSMNSILNDCQVNLDNATNNFKFQSEKLVTSKNHNLEIVKSSLIINPYQSHIDSLKNSLKLMQGNLIRDVDVNVETDRRDLELLKNNFMNASNEIILNNVHKLDSIKNFGIVKNPERLSESKKVELKNIKNKKILKNPYLILDSYKTELDIYKEKMDKINQVLELKQEQQKQKALYVKVIVAIVVVMIIVLIIMLGGI